MNTAPEFTTIAAHFRVFPEGDVIALWPQPEGVVGVLESYQHVGQHAPASIALVTDLPVATDEQKAALLLELQSLGYAVTDADDADGYTQFTANGERWSFNESDVCCWDEELGFEFQFFHRIAEPTAETVFAALVVRGFFA